MTKDYELEALLYAERYGIIEYEVTGHTMTWKESYPTEGTYLYRRDLKDEVSFKGELIESRKEKRS